MYKKVTELEGYYATGDYEAFCFDKHDGPREHGDALDNDPRKIEEDEMCDKWTNNEISEKEYDEWLEKSDFDRDYCRVYPNALLPDACDRMRGVKGNWRIEITFEPDPEELFRLLIK